MVDLYGPVDLSLNDLFEIRREQDGDTDHDPVLDHEPVTMPAVEVIEVNDDAAWALWEDSVAFQDSQFSDEALVACTMRTPLEQSEEAVEFIDPFASVHRKSSY